MQWPNGQPCTWESNSNAMLYAVLEATHISAVACLPWGSGKTEHVHGCCIDEKVDVNQTKSVRNASGATIDV